MQRGRLAAGSLASLLGEWRTDEPAYEALAERIRMLLIDGRISADVRLPSERELSERLDLSRTTVTAAYRRLRDGGYARSLQGSGTTTTLPRGTAHSGQAPDGLLDLTKATLPATRLLSDAARRATDDLAAHLGGSGYHLVGLPELREAIAQRYTRRGLPTTAEQVFVTSGAQSAIALLARTVVSRGDRAFVESPSYPHAYDALALAGARIVTSPVTPEAGWDMPALEATIRRTTPVLAYVMPDFQNPTGRSMSDDDRDRLLSAAASVDAIVAADETTAELSLDRRESHPPLGSRAERHGARVVHIGSASKLFWGGLRIGWLRADTELVERLTAARTATDLGTSVWDQLVVAHLLPDADAVVDERRAQLTALREALRTAVNRLLPDWRLPPGPHGGLVTWIQLPSPSSSQLVLAAQSRGILLTAGPRFGVDGAYERYLRIPLALSPEQLTEAIEVLADLWPRVAGTPAFAGAGRAVV